MVFLPLPSRPIRRRPGVDPPRLRTIYFLQTPFDPGAIVALPTTYIRPKHSNTSKRLVSEINFYIDSVTRETARVFHVCRRWEAKFTTLTVTLVDPYRLWTPPLLYVNPL